MPLIKTIKIQLLSNHHSFNHFKILIATKIEKIKAPIAFALISPNIFSESQTIKTIANIKTIAKVIPNRSSIHQI